MKLADSGALRLKHQLRLYRICRLILKKFLRHYFLSF